MTGRLDAGALDRLPAAVARPAYERGRVRPGVVHLGVGNFFRAHQAVAFDDLLATGATDWGVLGVSLRHADMRDALVPQGGLYTVLERGPEGAVARVIGALLDVKVAPEAPRAIVERLAARDTHWVTLTITEKGYGHDPASGALDPAHPDIAHDLAQPRAARQPRSALGLLHASLVLRRHRGMTAPTLASCDNLAGNGALLARLLRQFDAADGGPLGAWLDEVACPDSMVDRIVPRTTDADRAAAREMLGVADAWPVPAEPFTQWVIAERFAGARPPLEAAGVTVVADVAPYEAMKLRLLNAAHSLLAYTGVLAGHATVDAAIGDAALRALVEHLWREEAGPSLPAAVRAQAPDYCARLLARFANPALGHRTAQIAADGSQKLPMRIVPAIRDCLRDGRPWPALAFAVAAWIRYLGGVDDAGRRFTPDDPAWSRLAAAAGPLPDEPRARAQRVLAERAVFGDLAGEPAFVAPTLAALQAIGTTGTLAAARDALAMR